MSVHYKSWQMCDQITKTFEYNNKKDFYRLIRKSRMLINECSLLEKLNGLIVAMFNTKFFYLDSMETNEARDVRILRCFYLACY